MRRTTSTAAGGLEPGHSPERDAADPEELFLQNNPQQSRDKTVRSECLAKAWDHRIESDVRGGMTERKRRALLVDAHAIPRPEVHDLPQGDPGVRIVGATD